MEGLKLLIRNLAFILLLATFLEMLLPSKTMRGFVQLVMGLFVIVAIINPLANFLRLDFTNGVPAWVTVSSTELPVLASEGDSADQGKSAVREQYKRILVNQIEILVLAVDGVGSAEVEVELEEGTGGFSDYPQILKVNIVFSKQNVAIPPINPVVIGGNEIMSETAPSSDKAKAIRKQVSAFMQISEEIISVREKM